MTILGVYGAIFTQSHQITTLHEPIFWYYLMWGFMYYKDTTAYDSLLEVVF